MPVPGVGDEVRAEYEIAESRESSSSASPLQPPLRERPRTMNKGVRHPANALVNLDSMP
jgi:hypothetical protein